MGLKCSLLGHSFDETDVEREREERGSEVVTMVKEVERCSRCGESRVVSTNKEVTSIVEPEEVALDDGGDGGPAAGPGGPLGDGPSGGAVDSGYDSGSDVDALEATGDPDDEDAEILDDEEGGERAPGQWPDDEAGWSPDDLTRGETGEEPLSDVGDGPDAETNAGQGAGRNAGQTAEPDAAVGDRADGGAEAGAGDAGGGEFIDADADPANDPPGPATGESDEGDAEPDIPAGTYVCPTCGFTTRAENSPLRAGDACPECKRGYLEGGDG